MFNDTERCRDGFGLGNFFDEHGLAIAEHGFARPWQLKELQEREAFDFYEIVGDRLALYYRELAPAATVTINLDLKAELPGSFRGAASTAYLYYANECKRWATGLAVTVRP